MRILAEEFHLPNLSMGMSGDYTEAIKCGSTEIRLGTLLFGKRAVKVPNPQILENSHISKN
jgi:uncharacterized pyridoxal phosphate-containing UPF0001 family protein